MVSNDLLGYTEDLNDFCDVEEDNEVDEIGYFSENSLDNIPQHSADKGDEEGYQVTK